MSAESTRVQTSDGITFEDTTSNDDAEALRQARAHVYRQQHEGSHEQNRYDAREWLKRFGGKACCCPKCLKLEGRTDLAEAAP